MSNMSFSLSQSPQDPSIAYVVAQRLILRHWLLVFDEIQLLDVSSATLIADVLSWFWRMGGVIVGSSNKVPDDLYKNGVQRERLEPFVEALKTRCPVVLMRSERDWRAVRGTRGERSWYTFAQRREFENAVEGIVRGARTRDSEGANTRLSGTMLLRSHAVSLQKLRLLSYQSSGGLSMYHGPQMAIADSLSLNSVTK